MCNSVTFSYTSNSINAVAMKNDELAISPGLSPLQTWHLSFQGSHPSIEACFLVDDSMADWQVDTASTNLALRVACAGISKSTNGEAGVVPSIGHIGIQ